MMKKQVVTLLVSMVVLFAAAISQASQVNGSALGGETGIAKVISAESLPAQAFMIGVNGLYFYSNDLLNTAGDINQRFEGNINLTYGATDWLEVFLNESNSSQTITNNVASRHNLYQVFGDLSGGLKADWHIPYNIVVGMDAFAQLNTSTGAFGYQSSATNFGMRLLGTKEFDGIKNVPIVVDVNLGYIGDNSRYLLSGPNYTIGPYATVSDLYAAGLPNNEIEYALGVYHSDQVIGAVGIHVPFTYVTPFIQYYTNQIISSSGPSLHYDQSPQFIIPGARFTPVKPLAIDLGVELGITKVETLPVVGTPGETKDVRGVPLWAVILGASYTILPGTKAVQPVAQQQAGEIDGTVTGTTGLPLAAVVSISNTSVPPVGTDLKTGRYNINVPGGSYTITAAAQGFASQTSIVQVKNHKKITVDFVLMSRHAAFVSRIAQVLQKMTISAQSVHFAIGSAKIRPVFYSALDELVQLLKDNPSIHILIQGNTDNSGSVQLNQKLSQARADSVMQYLIQHGIAPKRLQAKGYGESRPVEPNTTSGARAINRRVTIQYTIE